MIRKIEVKIGTSKFTIDKLNHDKFMGAIKLAEKINENRAQKDGTNLPTILIKVIETKIGE